VARPLDPAALGDLIARVEHEIETGRLPNAQLAIARDGEVVARHSFGDATDDTRFVAFSTTKALVAAAVWTFLGPADDGDLRLGGRVVEWFPEFGAGGKEAVTLEHLLLHTAGFPRAPLGPPEWFDRDDRVARMAAWRLDWEPGTRCEYHASSAHWVLAELLERAGGDDFRTVVHTRVTQPLGLPQLLGAPAGAPGTDRPVATIVRSGTPATGQEIEAATGIAGLAAIDLPQEVDDTTLTRFNDPATQALGVPGGGAVATASEFALLYQAMLDDRAGVWDPDVLRDATGHVRNRLVDSVRGVVANRSAGLIIAGDDEGTVRRGFGAEPSPRAFGHDGVGGQLAWADPDTGISFAFFTSGLDRNPLREGRRAIGIATRASRTGRTGR
jgi:CubicO group peptidase (beta-lactamase class C family)